MKKVLVMLLTTFLCNSIFAQQGLDLEYIDKESSSELDKFTEIEMNLVGQFHYRYHSIIIGLTFDGEYLWFSDVTHDSIIAVNKNTGEKIKGFPSPAESDILGLAFDGERIWASAGHKVYKINSENGSLITSFTVPYAMTTTSNIAGLTWHNNLLYCTYLGGFDSKILGVDVENIVCVDIIDSGGSSSPCGLTFMNGFFWINDYLEITIRKVNPQYGQYEGWFPHYYLSKWVGIANDGEYMYCSDGFCNIYKYEIIDTVTSINENRNVIIDETKLSVYPNPSDNKVNIEFYLPGVSSITIEILSIDGILLKNIVSDNLFAKGKHTINWSTESILTGEYIVKLSTNKKQYTQKLIIRK